MAEANAAQKESVKCPICWDNFTRPRSLPCLHTFCEACLKFHISQTGQSQFLPFQCPVCRAETKPRKAYSERSTWAEQYPVNQWAVAKLEEIETQLKRNVDSCDVHSNHAIELFCKDHDCVCCPMCVAVDHRRCQVVLPIDEMLTSSPLTLQTHTEIHDNGQELKDTIHDLKQSRKEEAESMECRRKELTKTISDQKRVIFEHFNALESNLLRSMDESYEDLSRRIVNDMHWCSEAEAMLHETFNRTSSAEGAPSTKFVAMNKANSTYTKLQEAFNERNKDDLPDFMLLLNEDLVTIPDTFTTFGEILPSSELEEVVDTREQAFGVEPETAGNARLVSVKDSEGPESLETAIYEGNSVFFWSKDFHNKTVVRKMDKTCKKSYDMRRQLEKHCWITGMVCVRGGKYLLICDHTNKSLKIFKEDGMFVDSRQDASGPWCAALMSGARDRVAVSYPDEKLIRLFEVHIADFSSFRPLRKLSTSNLKCTKTINLNCPCYGLAQCGAELVVCCEQSIKVVSLSGRTLQTLTSNSKGESLFCKTIYAASSSRSATCYISDEGNSSVMSFKLKPDRTLSDEPEFVFNDKDLQNPRGLCVDSVGNVLVADFGSKNIFQLSPEGCLMSTFSIDLRPWTLCTNKDACVYVTSYPESDKQHSVLCFV